MKAEHIQAVIRDLIRSPQAKQAVDRIVEQGALELSVTERVLSNGYEVRFSQKGVTKAVVFAYGLYNREGYEDQYLNLVGEALKQHYAKENKEFDYKIVSEQFQID